MTLQQVIALIQQWIVQNGNEEITADVLRPILEEMVQQPNDLIGDLSELTTADQDNLVEAINEINANTGAGVVIHFGTALPNDTPPAEFSLGDFYAQLDDSVVETFWQYNGNEWVLIVGQKGIKTISTTPYTVQVEDLNRPLIFTSNNQVVNIDLTLVELAAEAGLTLYDFIAYFQGTGTHTINHPQSGQWTGSQGALVKGLCVDISGDGLWVIRKWFSYELDTLAATLLSQHTESDTTGDTGTNLLQPDFGAAIFTPADMQEGSVYEGSLLLEIENNSGSGTENPVTLFGIELFKFATAIPEIKGKLNFKITFYNQSFNNVDYKISFDFMSSGLFFIGTKTDTIDNSVSADIEFTVGGDVADIIKVNAPILQRC